MIEVGRVCLKIAGRDAGLRCVVVEVLDKNFVMIDGQTRRRKCNVIHLHPLDETVKVKAKASHEDVVKAFKELFAIFSCPACGQTLSLTEKRGESPKSVLSCECQKISWNVTS